MESNRWITYVLVVVAIVVIVLIAMSAGGSDTDTEEDAMENENTEESESNSSDSGSTGTTGTSSGSTTKGGGSAGGGSTATSKPAPTYQQLLAQYEGRHVQFDINCQARPKKATYKNGVSVMFDNRSGDARTITIDNKEYVFNGLGYRIVKLSSSNLPHTVNLSCGSAVNVGQITLQK